MSKAKKPRRKTTNPRGGKPTADEVAKMTGLGYVTVAEAAKAVGRAASSIYNRLAHVEAKKTEIPPAEKGKRSVVKTASGNVWLHLASIKKLYDVTALAAASEPAAS